MRWMERGRRWTIAASAIALVQAGAEARACDICAIYTGSLMRQDRTGLYAGVSEQYTDFGSVVVDGREAPNPDREWVHSSITQIVAGYQPLPWLAVQANLPVISRKYRRLEDGVAARGEEEGVGDLSLLARFIPLSRPVGPVLVHVELLGGIKTPTGDTDRLAEELGDGHGDDDEDDHDDGEDHEGHLAAGSPGDSLDPVHGGRHDGHEHPSAVHGHDLALGTGSVDGILGAALYADFERVFVHASLQYVVRGNGDFGYEYANDLTWELGPGYYVVAAHEWTAAVRLSVSGENKGRDHQQGSLAGDTAITALYAGPGMSLTWRDTLSAELTVDLPVDQDATGRQIVPDYRLRAGASWRF